MRFTTLFINIAADMIILSVDSIFYRTLSTIDTDDNPVTSQTIDILENWCQNVKNLRSSTESQRMHMENIKSGITYPERILCYFLLPRPYTDGTQWDIFDTHQAHRQWLNVIVILNISTLYTYHRQTIYYRWMSYPEFWIFRRRSSDDVSKTNPTSRTKD